MWPSISAKKAYDVLSKSKATPLTNSGPHRWRIRLQTHVIIHNIVVANSQGPFLYGEQARGNFSREVPSLTRTPKIRVHIHGGLKHVRKHKKTENDMK